MIGGGADGWIYAMQGAHGRAEVALPVSQRGLNSPVAVVGDTVYAAHGEENVDGGFMGRVVAIDGTGTGDVTKTHELWRADDLLVGFAGAHRDQDGRLYVIDNSANIHALDAKTGKPLWTHKPRHDRPRGSPVWADGKLYLTEVNGNVQILEPGRRGPRS